MQSPINGRHPAEHSPYDMLRNNAVAGFEHAMRCVQAVCDEQQRLNQNAKHPWVLVMLFVDPQQMSTAAALCLAEYQRARDEMEAKLAAGWIESSDQLVSQIGQAMASWDYSDLVL